MWQRITTAPTVWVGRPDHDAPSVVPGRVVRGGDDGRVPTTRTPPALVEPADTRRNRVGLSSPSVAAFAAVQGWVLSVLVVVLPTLAAALTAAEPGDQPGWGAGRFGLRVWLLAHGVPQSLDTVVVSLVPLGLTALAVSTLFAATRRAQVASGSGALVATVSYAGLTVATALVAQVGVLGVVRAAAGGLVVAALGTGLGLVRTTTRSDVAGRVRHQLASPVRAGLRAVGLAVALVVVVVALLVVVWVVAGRSTVCAVVRGLPLDTVGGLVYALAQLAYLPDLMVWALAWLSGAGFVVGSGTQFAPGEMVGGPMPAVPLLGALPTWTAPGHLALVAPGVLVVVGVVVGVYLHRRAPDGVWWHRLAAVGTCAGGTAVVVAIMVAAASG